MESLLATLKSKEKEISSIPKGKKKFMTRKQIEQQQRQEQNEKLKAVEQPKTSTTDETTEPIQNKKRQRDDEELKLEEERLLPKKQVIRLLRKLNQPITLFGESDRDRQNRLREVEKAGHGKKDDEDLALQGSHGMRNTFLSKDGQDQDDLDSDDEGSKRKVRKVEKIENTPEQEIRDWIKQMLGEWNTVLLNRTESEKTSAKGKIELKTYKQCKDYIRPMVKMLKKRGIAADIVLHVHKIVQLCKQREYRQAADWYLKLAIGNSPWPIGVTMVGIHERTGRERIEASKVAHVMNDESQRKYITSLKRLMTFSQEQYPADPSKMILS